MKVFKFPTWSNYQKENKLHYRPEEKYLIIRDPKTSSKSSLNKKATSSLDCKKFLQKKRVQLEMVYSAEKKKRSKSQCSTTNYCFNTSPQRRILQPRLASTSKKDFIPEKRLSLKNDTTKSKIIFNQMNVYAQSLMKRLRENMYIQSDKLFVQNYVQTFKWFKDLENQEQKNESYICLKKLVNILLQCEQRKKENELNVFYDSLGRLQKQKCSLNLQIKKVKLKCETSEHEIEKLTNSNNDLQREINKLKEENNKIYKSYALQTEDYQKDSSCLNIIGIEQPKNQINDVSSNKAMIKVIKQIRQLKQRQRHVTVLLNQMKKQGFDLSQIYIRGVKSIEKSKQKAKNDENEDISSLEDSETSYNQFLGMQSHNFMESIQKKQGEYDRDIQKQHKKRKCEKKKIMELQEYDADNSITDDIEALSFNYEDKELMMDQYTPRRVYQCKKPLEQEMKKKLALNFNILYEDESGISSQQAFPTI